MISALITWLVLVIVVCLLYWVLSQFAPAPILKVALVVCVVIVVLSLIFLLLPLAGIHLEQCDDNDLKMNLLKTIGGVKVYQESGALLYKTGATVNGDGSPHCYHQDDAKGLDYLANAGSPGNWWGIATDSKGKPIVQSIYDVAPGFYVSTTALANPAYSDEVPQRYLDSERYPFMVVPGSFGQGWKCGDVGFCYNEKTSDNMYCVTGDIGPADHIGEVSMLLARCLGLDYDPKAGGCESGIIYVAFPGSDPLYREWRQKCQIAQDTFNKWGGMNKLKELMPKL